MGAAKRIIAAVALLAVGALVAGCTSAGSFGSWDDGASSGARFDLFKWEGSDCGPCSR